MSHTTTQQFTEATQKNVDIIHDFMRTSLKGLEKLTKLNLDTSRKLIEKTSDSMKDISHAQNSQEILENINQFTTASIENNIAACRNVFDVCSETQAKLGQMFETHFQHAHDHFSGVIDALSPNKSNFAAESMKSWANNANQTMAAIQKVASQVSEFTSNNAPHASKDTKKKTAKK
jgi:phasin family protein